MRSGSDPESAIVSIVVRRFQAATFLGCDITHGRTWTARLASWLNHDGTCEFRSIHLRLNSRHGLFRSGVRTLGRKTRSVDSSEEDRAGYGSQWPRRPGPGPRNTAGERLGS